MKVISLFSGGLDSTVLIKKLQAYGYEVLALSFDYGQKHRIELDHAVKLADCLGVKHEIIDFSFAQKVFGKSALTNSETPVPTGTYSAEILAQTVVPNRNMIFLSIATALAISQKIKYVAYGAHKNDYAVYTDCRPVFVEAIGKAINYADGAKVELLAPFVEMSKGEIVQIGAALKTPLEMTYSCYLGGDIHCGHCSTCRDRKDAFHEAGVKDETKYVEVSE